MHELSSLTTLPELHLDISRKAQFDESVVSEPMMQMN
jgi:hypothetical protein